MWACACERACDDSVMIRGGPLSRCDANTRAIHLHDRGHVSHKQVERDVPASKQQWESGRRKQLVRNSVQLPQGRHLRDVGGQRSSEAIFGHQPSTSAQVQTEEGHETTAHGRRTALRLMASRRNPRGICPSANSVRCCCRTAQVQLTYRRDAWFVRLGCSRARVARWMRIHIVWTNEAVAPRSLCVRTSTRARAAA